MMRHQRFKWLICAVTLLTFSVNFSESASAQVTHQLVVNPIQVCDDDGIVCANPDRELFLEETDKIWSQAGLDIKFLDWKVLQDSDVLNGATLFELGFATGSQELGGDVINMWFVQSTDSGSYGTANINGRRSMIANSVFSYSGGAGRRDTIAHELGHTLNLPHISGDFPLNVMESGGVRNPATALDQIFPDGAQKDQLNSSQVNTVLNSNFVNPLQFSIPGDANIDGNVNQIDVQYFVDGWLNVQEDPDINSWMKGDFDLDGKTTLFDAVILHQALIGNGQGEFDFSLLSQSVPEPHSLILMLLGSVSALSLRRRR